MTDNQFTEIKQSIREYHADVKRRLDIVEDRQEEHHTAIHGNAGDLNVPGLNVQVQGLLGFRERVRLGIASAWAAIFTILITYWQKAK